MSDNTDKKTQPQLNEDQGDRIITALEDAFLKLFDWGAKMNEKHFGVPDPGNTSNQSEQTTSEDDHNNKKSRILARYQQYYGTNTTTNTSNQSTQNTSNSNKQPKDTNMKDPAAEYYDRLNRQARSEERINSFFWTVCLLLFLWPVVIPWWILKYSAIICWKILGLFFQKDARS